MTQGDQDVFRIGLIGCGRISYRHGRAAAASDKARIAACCDLREAVAKEWSAEYGCEAFYTDFEEMIRVHDLDGLILVTWPSQRREQIERCLNAGARNILSEKALTITGQDALEIAELVESAGAVLMEGFMFRHHPLIAKLERLVGAGKIGRVDSVNARSAPSMPRRMIQQTRIEIGGMTQSVSAGPHGISPAMRSTARIISHRSRQGVGGPGLVSTAAAREFLPTPV